MSTPQSSVLPAVANESTILIIGLGMIGGSIACGLRLALPDCRLLAVDASAEALALGIDRSVIDGAAQQTDESLSDAAIDLLAQADVVVLCVPPLAIAGYFPFLLAHCKSQACFTDVGSVKSHLLPALAEMPTQFRVRFVPGHPIAGSERSGFAAADPDLFRRRRVILTPLPENSAVAVNRVHSLWHCLGAQVIGMGIDQHDKVLAATSHLPHALAYAIVDALDNSPESEDIFRFAAGGFADFSRLASSNARMWSDVFTANADATAAVLEDYIANLKRLKALIQARESGKLEDLFNQSKKTRERFLKEYFDKRVGEPGQPESSVEFRVAPGGQLQGSVRVPGDKSISHRSVILGSIADGVTQVDGFLEGEDALNTVAAFREMGVTISGPENGRVTIYGVGKHGLRPPRETLYMGNSGTAMRLLAGLLAAQSFESSLSGDESLNQRPMGRVANPLATMGAAIETAAEGRPPLHIRGRKLQGISYDMPMASAQVKSCLLLAGLYADGITEVLEPAPCRDHTERMLAGFGYEVNRAGAKVSLNGEGELQGQEIDVPADISSAAFFLVGASIAEGSELLLQHVGVNPTRIGIVNLLQMMGGDIELQNQREVGGEPVADIRVRSAKLKGIEIPEDQIPLAIDEFPVLFIAAACAEGDTVLRGAEELRVKESDRIAAMAAGLVTLGVEHEVFADGVRIRGGEMAGGAIDSLGDHRIAMAFTIAALRAKSPIHISNCENVATSFPGFVALARAAGIQIEAQRLAD